MASGAYPGRGLVSAEVAVAPGGGTGGAIATRSLLVGGVAGAARAVLGDLVQSRQLRAGVAVGAGRWLRDTTRAMSAMTGGTGAAQVAVTQPGLVTVAHGTPGQGLDGSAVRLVA